MLEVRIIDLNEVIGEYEDMLRRLLGETITVNICSILGASAGAG